MEDTEAMLNILHSLPLSLKTPNLLSRSCEFLQIGANRWPTLFWRYIFFARLEPHCT